MTKLDCDYVIYGGGPSGLILAILLSEKYTDKRIVVVERESKLGGCWRMEWKKSSVDLENGDLFTEHAPRVITGNNFRHLLKYLELSPDSLLMDVYKSKWNTIYMFCKDIFKNSTWSDLYKFSIHYILYMLYLNNDTRITAVEYTVEDWLNKYKFSENFKRIIRRFSILIADIPSRVTLYDLFNSMNTVSFKRLRESEEWINRIGSILANKGVEIIYNTELTRFVNNTRTIVKRNNREYTIDAMNTIMCISPHVISDVLMKSPNKIRYNWGMDIPKILSDSYYMCIGFQLHYTEKLSIDECYSLTCKTDWDIVILDISKESKVTKNDNIKTVLSCGVIDKTLANKYSTHDSLSKELKRQMITIANVEPKYLTFYDGVNYNKEKNRWESKDSGYNRQKTNKLVPYKGNISNISLVGAFNTVGVSTIDKAIENAVDYMEEFSS
jgi:hypothetical protein